jgi:quinol monooxygenase YgiN
MHRVNITINPRDDKQKELLLFCQMITDQTRQKAGCSSSCLLLDKSHIILDQQWEHFNLLEDYFRSDPFSALLGAMKFLGKNYAVAIDSGTGKDGMIMVEKIRSK